MSTNSLTFAMNPDATLDWLHARDSFILPAQTSHHTSMKTLIILIAFILSIAFAAVTAEKPAKSKKLLHVVAFKFKASASPARLREVVEALATLKKKVPARQSLEEGV